MIAFLVLSPILPVFINTEGAASQAAPPAKLQLQVPQLDILPKRTLLKGNAIESKTITSPPVQPPTNVNGWGFAETDGKHPTTVTYVQPGSLAWQAGLAAGDKIEFANPKLPLLILTVQRKGKRYLCILRPSTPTLDLSKGDKDKPLQGKVDETAAQTLSNYSIVFVVDNSASMGTKDCPGEVSRWQWCRDHIKSLYAEDRGKLEKNISIITFDNNFRSHRNSAPSELTGVFQTSTPTGETMMAPALQEAFSLVARPLDQNKPAVICVITDGRPSDADNVKQGIIRQVNRLRNAKLLSIVFIEVGTPEKFLKEIDTDLVKQGANQDIISVVPLATADSQGLSKSLAAAVPKLDEKKADKPLTATVVKDTVNHAREAVNSHIITLPAVQPKRAPTAPVKVVQPQVKAHPTGVNPEATKEAKAKVKVQEIDEKEEVLKNSANKTYK